MGPIGRVGTDDKPLTVGAPYRMVGLEKSQPLDARKCKATARARGSHPRTALSLNADGVATGRTRSVLWRTANAP